MPYTQKPSTCLRIVFLFFFFLPALRLAPLCRSESQAQSSRPTGRWPRRVFDESSGAAASWLLRSKRGEADARLAARGFRDLLGYSERRVPLFQTRIQLLHPVSSFRSTQGGPQAVTPKQNGNKGCTLRHCQINPEGALITISSQTC